MLRHGDRVDLFALNNALHALTRLFAASTKHCCAEVSWHPETLRAQAASCSLELLSPAFLCVLHRKIVMIQGWRLRRLTTSISGSNGLA